MPAVSASNRAAQRSGCVGSLLLALGGLACVASVFSVVLAVVTFAVQQLTFWDVVLVVVLCGAPVAAAVAFIGAGIWRLRVADQLHAQAVPRAASPHGSEPNLAPIVDMQRLAQAARSFRFRGVLAGAFSVPIGAFAGFAGIATVLAAPNYVGDAMGLGAVGIFLVVGVLVPAGIAAWLAIRAFANRRTLGRIRLLTVALEKAQPASVEQLAEAMGVHPVVAQATLAAAIGRGIVAADAVARFREAPHAGGTDEGGQFNRWLGRVFDGQYLVEGELGRGGMGVVLRARDREGRMVAIKLLHSGATDPASLARFEREALTAQTLGHPNIIRVHRLGRGPDGTMYIVMDLLDGETLEARLGRVGPLPWRQACELASQVGDALSAAHAAGVLHRDVKPANVFLARMPEGERPMLLDFGLAKRVESGTRLTATGAAVGTPLYMAPEQARGEAVDVRTDLFGLGVLLHEMATGTPPFFDTNLARVYARLLRDTQPPTVTSSGVMPKGLHEVLTKALAIRPEDRYESVDAFLAALRAFESGCQPMASAS